MVLPVAIFNIIYNLFRLSIGTDRRGRMETWYFLWKISDKKFSMPKNYFDSSQTMTMTYLTVMELELEMWTDMETDSLPMMYQFETLGLWSSHYQRTNMSEYVYS